MMTPLMTRRGPLTVALLSFATCGLYTLFWVWSTSKELEEITDSRDINPLLDVILVALTGFLWLVWLGYRNTSILHQEIGAGARPTTPEAVAGFVALSWMIACPHFVGPALLQREYNAYAEAVDPNAPMGF